MTFIYSTIIKKQQLFSFEMVMIPSLIFEKAIWALVLLFFMNSTFGQTQKDIVNTPFGPASKSNIHYVDNSHYLNIKNGEIQIVNSKSGNIDEIYSNKEISKATTVINNYKDGWNTYAVYGTYQIDKPPTYFSARWIVPPAPNKSDQLLYFFNGFQGSDYLEDGNRIDHIVQPVLQWGSSPSGGGNYWAICNWYVNDHEYFYDSLIVVSPGTILQGVLKQTSSVNNRFIYNSSFYGYSTSLQIENLPELKLTYIALESYNAERSDEYPTNEKIKFFDICIETDIKNPMIHWDLYNDEKSPNDLGQFTKVINSSSDGGEIEIYYRKPYSNNGFDEIHFYPNPFNDFLHISPNRIKHRVPIFPDIPITNCKIEVLNSFGRLIKSDFFESLENEFNLDLKNLNPGLYIIRFSYNNEIHAFKIIKN